MAMVKDLKEFEFNPRYERSKEVLQTVANLFGEVITIERSGYFDRIVPKGKCILSASYFKEFRGEMTGFGMRVLCDITDPNQLIQELQEWAAEKGGYFWQVKDFAGCGEPWHQGKGLDILQSHIDECVKVYHR